MALMGLGVLTLRQRQFELAVTQLMHGAKVEPNDLNLLLLALARRVMPSKPIRPRRKSRKFPRTQARPS